MAVGVAVAVGDVIAVGVEVAVTLTVGVGVGLVIAVGVAVAVAVADEVAVAVGVAVAVAVTVGVAVAVTVGVAVAVADVLVGATVAGVVTCPGFAPMVWGVQAVTPMPTAASRPASDAVANGRASRPRLDRPAVFVSCRMIVPSLPE